VLQTGLPSPLSLSLAPSLRAALSAPCPAASNPLAVAPHQTGFMDRAAPGQQIGCQIWLLKRLTFDW
jgi:hypothetical protein